MSRPQSGAAATAMILSLTASLVMPVAAAGLDDAVRRLAESVGQVEPLMRIGLESAHAVEISSAAPYRVIDPRSGETVWRSRFDGPLRVVADGGPQGDVAVVYRIQVGAFGSAAAAEAERERLSRETGAPAVVRHDPDRGNWRVRVGKASDRLELNPLLERLRADGAGQVWIAEEPAAELRNVTLRLVDASYESRATDAVRLVVLPAAAGRIAVAGAPYRGAIELRVTEFGTVRPINWVGLEVYLLGVVPRELGPEVWPQLEALKAQAVAARTYAWRNRGQFENDGYDLCATPRCQVYGGAGAEHPLSDRAVTATRGEVLTWQERPIVAYYTATCGGHTEDGHEIFPEGDAVPYLAGVPCRAEDDALATLRGTLVGQTPRTLVDEAGHDVGRAWALLVAAGVIRTDEAANAAEPITPSRLRAWTLRLARLSGLPEPAGEPPPLRDLADAATAIVADLGWSERAQVLLSGQDLSALLRGDPEALELAEPARRAVAYLALVEALQPAADGRYGVAEPASASRVLQVLAQIAETYRAFGLRDGVVSGMGKASLRLVQGKGELRLEVGEQPFLFGRGAGRTVPLERLEIWPGDRVKFRTGSSGRIDYLEVSPPVKGVSDDRSAVVYSWDERKTRRELEATINRRVSVGELRDLRVVRRGVSGRVVELDVVGEGATTRVRGFDVRRLLDLRESLVVLEIQRAPGGDIEAVVFAGKGWGHGVGLCQVGAYGMALRGASYREILAHYYRETALVPLERSGG